MLLPHSVSHSVYLFPRDPRVLKVSALVAPLTESASLGKDRLEGPGSTMVGAGQASGASSLDERAVRAQVRAQLGSILWQGATFLPTSTRPPLKPTKQQKRKGKERKQNAKNRIG